jgi:NADP-dependent 3-hydroxy acid dehydrogenase YdfG
VKNVDAASISGASHGLGREMALRFAREGAAGLSDLAFDLYPQDGN